MDEFLRQAWEDLFAGWEEARRVTALWQPTFRTGSPWLAPGVALGALLALIALSGISLLALGVLLTALLAAYLIINNVFGVSIELMVP